MYWWGDCIGVVCLYGELLEKIVFKEFCVVYVGLLGWNIELSEEELNLFVDFVL